MLVVYLDECIHVYIYNEFYLFPYYAIIIIIIIVLQEEETPDCSCFEVNNSSDESTRLPSFQCGRLLPSSTASSKFTKNDLNSAFGPVKSGRSSSVPLVTCDSTWVAGILTVNAFPRPIEEQSRNRKDPQSPSNFPSHKEFLSNDSNYSSPSYSEDLNYNEMTTREEETNDTMKKKITNDHDDNIRKDRTFDEEDSH